MPRSKSRCRPVVSPGVDPRWHPVESVLVQYTVLAIGNNLLAMNNNNNNSNHNNNIDNHGIQEEVKPYIVQSFIAYPKKMLLSNGTVPLSFLLLVFSFCFQ
jgi:hypothetical protein